MTERKNRNGEQKTYSDSNIRGWNETNDSCQKENMKGDIDNWRSQIDKKIWQCWSDSQKEHVVQQLLSPFCYLKTENTKISSQPRI